VGEDIKMEIIKKLNVAPDILAVIARPPFLTRESKDEYFDFFAGINKANIRITARLRTKIGGPTGGSRHQIFSHFQLLAFGGQAHPHLFRAWGVRALSKKWSKLE
jgi:hypothetical protein